MTLNLDDLPTRSADGKAALDIFYDEFNDINFYVEDEDQENLYEEILRRLFPRISISRIFPLGGKEAVLSHARSDANSSISGFRAYLVDKDFDDLLGQVVAMDNLFYLERFCIESYLLEHGAIIELVVENHPKKKRAEIGSSLKLSESIPSIYASLRDLFLLFYCVQYFDLGIKNCSLSPEAFCHKRKLWEPNTVAILAYKDSVAQMAQAKGVQPPLLDPNGDQRLHPAIMASAHSLISGKFVASMVFHYVKSEYGLGSMTFESFVYRLAKNCELKSLKPLARKIGRSAKIFRTQRSALIRAGR